MSPGAPHLEKQPARHAPHLSPLCALICLFVMLKSSLNSVSFCLSAFRSNLKYVCKKEIHFAKDACSTEVLELDFITFFFNFCNLDSIFVL